MTQMDTNMISPLMPQDPQLKQEILNEMERYPRKAVAQAKIRRMNDQSWVFKKKGVDGAPGRRDSMFKDTKAQESRESWTNRHQTQTDGFSPPAKYSHREDESEEKQGCPHNPYAKTCPAV